MLGVTVGLNVLNGSTADAFSSAASFRCMIIAVGTVSGAHFNTAATEASMCAGRGKRPPKGATYLMVKLLGGLCEALVTHGWADVIVAELIFTLMLAFVVPSVVTVNSSLSQFFGFAIGMCLTIGGCVIGKVKKTNRLMVRG